MILSPKYLNGSGVEDIGIAQYQGEDYEFVFRAEPTGQDLYFEINISPILGPNGEESPRSR